MAGGDVRGDSDDVAIKAENGTEGRTRERSSAIAKQKKLARNKLSAETRAWLWHQCAPEAYWFVSGLLGSTISGLGRPVLGFLMAEFLIVFYSLDVASMRDQAKLWGLIFLGMGAVQATAAAMQQVSYSIITERMVLRVRTLAFESILRQPIGWFDESAERSAGALANRLSTDCFLIKALTGERAGLAVAQLAVVVAGCWVRRMSQRRVRRRSSCS